MRNDDFFLQNIFICNLLYYDVVDYIFPINPHCAMNIYNLKEKKASWYKEIWFVYIYLGKKIGDSINETEFVKILSKKIQGNLTLTSEETEEHSSEYKSAGIVTKVSYRNILEKIHINFKEKKRTEAKQIIVEICIKYLDIEYLVNKQ